MQPNKLLESCGNFLNDIKKYYPSALTQEFKIKKASTRLKKVLNQNRNRCDYQFHCRIGNEKRANDRRIFKDSFTNFKYQYCFSSMEDKRTYDDYLLKNTVGVYFVSLRNRIIYIGDTNNTLEKRLNGFIHGLNFGNGHACGNKICWLKNQKYLERLMDKNEKYLSDISMKEFYKSISDKSWYALKGDFEKASSFDFHYIMFKKKAGEKYNKQQRRILSMLESHAILTCLEKEPDSLNLNYD
jgi:hypothetical protein